MSSNKKIPNELDLMNSINHLDQHKKAPGKKISEKKEIKGGSRKNIYLQNKIIDQLEKYTYWERKISMSKVIEKLLLENIFDKEYEEIPKEDRKNLKG